MNNALTWRVLSLRSQWQRFVPLRQDANRNDPPCRPFVANPPKEAVATYVSFQTAGPPKHHNLGWNWENGVIIQFETHFLSLQLGDEWGRLRVGAP
jgi:hypothetical protein